MNSTFLKTAPLMLAGSLALFGGSAAHAQGFTFTAPTTTTFTAHPGDDIGFSGTFQNTAFVDFMNVTINLGPAPGSYPGKFTFTSSSTASDLGFGSTFKFTGLLHISKTATFTSSAFYLDASGTQDDDGTGPQQADLTSNNFTVKLTPNVPSVPEASSLVSTGILLTLGLGAFALRSRKRSAAKLG